MTNARSLVLGSAIVCVVAASTNLAAAQPPDPAPRFRETVFLDTDSAATKKLGALQEYLSSRQWGEAVQLANQILEQHGGKLIAAGTGRYIDLRTRCHALLATMDAEGLQTLRQQIDPQARQWLEDGLANHDEAPLRKIVQLAFLSSYGDDALAALGEIAFQRGAYGDARGYWEMTLPLEPAAAAGEAWTVLTYPDTDRDRAELRARLVLCSLFQRDLPRFESELAAFKQRHADAEGKLAGQTGRLADILQNLAEQAKKWPQATSDSGMTTFAGNASRNSVLGEAIDDIGAVQWSRPLKPVTPTDLPRRAGLARPIYLSYFPIVVGDILFVNDDTTISAFDLLTGKPAWAGPDSDDAVIYRTLRPIGNPDGAVRAGIPRYTMTAYGSRLYARMGSPVTGRTDVDPLTRSDSHLVCLDVAAGQGKTVWTVEAGEIAQQKGSWEFEGSPVVADGKVYAALRNSSPQPQANVACFDAEDGRLLWNRKVCTFLASGENVEEVSHQLLTLGEGTLFYSTNQGAIAALDVHDGMINWVVTYERRPQRPWTSQLKNGLVPCLYHQGMVIAAPADLKQVAVRGGDARQFWRTPTTGTVMGIDAKTGIQKWSKELTGGVRHLLGVSQNRLIVSGDYLWALDLDTGRTIWSRGQQDIESYGYGRGLLAGDLVFWPKRDTIWAFNAQTGDPHAEIALGPWRTDTGPQLTGGNLLMSGGMLVVAQAEALVAYAQWGRLKQQLREELSAAPADPRLHFKLARAEQASGNWELALNEYRRAVHDATPHDQFQNRPLKSYATEKLVELLMLVGQRAANDGDANAAARLYREALTFPVAADLRLEVIRRLAAACGELSNPRQSIDAWQEILSDPQLAEMYFQDARGQQRRAYDVARTQIDMLLQAHSSKAYAQVEERAAQEINALPVNTSPGEVRAVLTRYPHAEAAADRWLTVATRYVEEHDYDAAIGVFEQLIDHRDGDTRQSALLGMARALEHSQHWRRAREVWRELAVQFPDARLPVSEPPMKLADYVASHLNEREFARQSQMDAPPEVGLPLSRRWSCSLGRGSRVLIPTGQPPALLMQSVIVAGDRLNCLNIDDGSLRWQAAAADEYTWAAYAGSRLLFAGPRGLEAVSLRTGQRLWRTDAVSLESPQLLSDGRFSQVCFLERGELACARATDGIVTWRFHPPEGAVQPQWLLAGDRCVLQTLSPDRLFVVDAFEGTLLADCRGPADAWPVLPCPLDDGFLAISVGTNAKLTRHRFDGVDRWRYPHRISQTNTLPDILTNGRAVTLVEDGDTLIRVGADDGRKLWSTGLGIRILPHARDRLCIDDTAVYAENEGILRAYRLEDGSVGWEQFLGDDDVSWQITRHGSYLLALPAFHDRPAKFTVLFSDPATGEFIQKMQLAGQGRVDLHVATGMTLVRSDDFLYALARM